MADGVPLCAPASHLQRAWNSSLSLAVWELASTRCFWVGLAERSLWLSSATAVLAESTLKRHSAQWLLCWLEPQKLISMVWWARLSPFTPLEGLLLVFLHKLHAYRHFVSCFRCLCFCRHFAWRYGLHHCLGVTLLQPLWCSWPPFGLISHPVAHWNCVKIVCRLCHNQSLVVLAFVCLLKILFLHVCPLLVSASGVWQASIHFSF